MIDWQAGDLAFCTKQGPWIDRHGDRTLGPVSGQILVVHGVGVAEYFDGEDVGLAFLEFPDATYRHIRFVKLTPPEDLIEEERKEDHRIPEEV